MTRSVAHVATAPPPAPGFIGAGHTAVEVVAPTALDVTDPFVLLMHDGEFTSMHTLARSQRAESQAP